MSSTNLSESKENSHNSDNDFNYPSSWISTPDLANMQDDTQPITTVNLQLPKRKIKPIDTGQRTGIYNKHFALLPTFLVIHFYCIHRPLNLIFESNFFL